MLYKTYTIVRRASRCSLLMKRIVLANGDMTLGVPTGMHRLHVGRSLNFALTPSNYFAFASLTHFQMGLGPVACFNSY